MTLPFRALPLSVLALYVRADVRLPAIISDHMVLQRDVRVPIWGTASPGEKVTVDFAGERRSSTTGADGRWRVELMNVASGAPRVLAVQGNNTILIQDVLVGEVWLGSGQSNMALTVSRSQNFEREKSTAAFPLIRQFREDSPTATTVQSGGSGKWVRCAPETVGSFSAALYFFGRELHQTLNVPVGLINSSAGGSAIESWIAPEAQRECPELRPFFAAMEKENVPPSAAVMKEFESHLAAWEIEVRRSRAENRPAPARPPDPAEAHARRTNVGGLFNGKIAPLIPYAFRGMLWYQGEANTIPFKAPFYQFQLPLLVRDWRARWGRDFPVAWVQLPNFTDPGRDWPTLREAMLKTLAMPNTGMAITIDIGESNDVHPRNKQEVGHRLALWALGTVYGRNVPSISGPLPVSHAVRGREIVIAFKHADGGLVAKDGPLRGFTIAGRDHQWKPAAARIEGDTVIASSTDIESPIAVRYAWENNPSCNLFNAAGLPASPFRINE